MKKKIFTFLTFLSSIVLGVFAQSYYYQNVVCGACNGSGGYMTYYGPVYCSVCAGRGYISVPVPVQPSSPSFQGNSRNNKIKVSKSDVDCKGHAGSLCSCTKYVGYKIEGTDYYVGNCQNRVNGHVCGHSPAAHGLPSY